MTAIDEKPIEKQFQDSAKNLVDLLYNNGLLNGRLTRNDFKALEDVIAFEYQSSKDSVVKTDRFIKSLELSKKIDSSWKTTLAAPKDNIDKAFNNYYQNEDVMAWESAEKSDRRFFREAVMQFIRKPDVLPAKRSKR